MRPGNTQALYLQISEAIEEQISRGVYLPGQQLPTEQELSKTFDVNRHTIREAIKELKHDGLVYSLRGKGIFVSSDKIIYRLSSKVQFSQNILEANLIPGARLLGSRVIKAGQKLAEKFSLDAEDEVLVLDVLRLINEIPFILATVYMPSERFAGLENHINGTFSLYQILSEHYQVEPVRHESLFEAGLPDKQEMEHLQISQRNPLLVVRSLSCDQQGRAVEYVVSRIRGDLGCLSVRFIDPVETAAANPVAD